MIKTITQYPTQTGFDFGGTVRHFDESLQELIQDLEDTMIAYDLEGLSAFQISSPLSVIVIQYEGEFLAMINPMIFTRLGAITPIEETAYYPNLTATTKRAKKIKVRYDDIHGKQQFLTASDDLSVLIQRKTDYLMGSSFIARLSKEEKKIFEYKIKNQSNELPQENCSISPFSDKILKMIKYALLIGLIPLLIAFFISIPFVETFEKTLMLGIASLIGFYFILALYEGKRCGVCQLGNTIAVALIKSVHLGGLYLLNVWVVFQ
jgi:peptide deformylase